ncbi:MAG TPA: hypothetical protein PLQ13_10045, partial [Candidatus Krumholzibacteria bacterium]|nr:hypothetical protein [Candidatus Krumholzibacteria bacterium]
VKLSTAELKKLLAARERIDVLEAERQRLSRELAAVDRELAALLKGAVPSASAGPARKAAKKTAKKATKKATKKAARKASGKGPGKAAKKTPRKRPGGRLRLEDVIVGVIGKAGGRMAYQDLYKAIVKGKLFPTKATNFDNVLRRTLSTSGAVKRAGRGIYAVA